MKLKVTRTKLKDYDVIQIGYCDMQSIVSLADISPIAYGSGIYGWNYDIYETQYPGVLICTGYRPIGNINGNRIVDKYEKKAKAMREKTWRVPYSKKGHENNKKKAKKLFEDFVDECLKTAEG